MEPPGKGLEHIQLGEQPAPVCRDRVDAVVGAGELAVDRTGRVRVFAEVDGEQRAVFEARAARERPERGLERAGDVAVARVAGGEAEKGAALAMQPRHARYHSPKLKRYCRGGFRA